jgi:hypothetical protein
MTGHCAHFDFVGCDRWITGCFACPQKTRYPASKVFDRSKKTIKLRNRYLIPSGT